MKVTADNLNVGEVDELILELDRFKNHLLSIYQEEETLEYTQSEDYEDREPLMVHGYPVFQFAYAGRQPLKDLYDYKVKQYIQNYIEWCTESIYRPKRNSLPLQKARVVIQHFFTDDQIIDLDNINNKYLIDALRSAQIIEDDKWQIVSLDISGHYDTKEHVQVYVVAEENKYDFIQFLDRHKYDLKIDPYPHEMFTKESRRQVIQRQESILEDDIW